MNVVPCNPIFNGWQLRIAWCWYLFLCLFLALALRVLHSLFRALAVQRGDFPEATDDNTITEFREAFWYCFNGRNEFKEHSDLWIPTAIGFTEFAAYPVLLVLGQHLLVGAWIGIKTAGGWTGWKASRTSFNRFLLFNILTLVLAYFWLSKYIERLPC